MTGRIAGRIRGPGVVDTDTGPREAGEPMHVGDILPGIALDDRLTPEARCAITVGMQGRPHQGCPCIYCHKHYGTI